MNDVDTVVRIADWIRNWADPEKSMDGYASAHIISNCLERGCWRGVPCDYCKSAQVWWHSAPDLSNEPEPEHRFRAFQGLGPDELRVLAYIAARLRKGAELYGELDLSKMDRDWEKEASEEAADLMVYRTFARLMKRGIEVGE